MWNSARDSVHFYTLRLELMCELTRCSSEPQFQLITHDLTLVIVVRHQNQWPCRCGTQALMGAVDNVQKQIKPPLAPFAQSSPPRVRFKCIGLWFLYHYL